MLPAAVIGDMAAAPEKSCDWAYQPPYHSAWSAIQHVLGWWDKADGPF